MSRAPVRSAAVRRVCATASVLLTALVAGAGGASAAPGDVDRGFGEEGTVLLRLSPTGDARMAQVLPSSDGSTLTVGGIVDGAGVIVKRLADGQPDPDFGNEGIARTKDAMWRRIYVQSDGKLVTFGRVGREAAIARFLPNGAPDTAFGEDGVALPEFRSQFSTNPDVVLSFSGAGLDSAGRPVGIAEAGGCDRIVDSNCSHVAMVRLNTSGSIDLDFGGGDGVAQLRTMVSGYNLGAGLAAIAGDDSIVIAEATSFEGDDLFPPSSGITIGRFNQDGTRILSFGKKGLTAASTGNSTSLPLLEVGEDSSVTASTGPEILRFTPDGSLDRRFGVKGRISISNTMLGRTSGVYPSSVDSVARGPDGRFYMSGIDSINPDRQGSGRHDARVFAVRLTEEGEPDPTFANDGLAHTPLGQSQYFTYEDYFRAGAGTTPIVGQDGSVTVAATTLVDDQQRFTLTRFLGGSLPRPNCDGIPATVMGTDGDDRLKAGAVTVTGPGDDRVSLEGGLTCTGPGDDSLTGGGDVVFTGSGADTVRTRWERGQIHAGGGDDSITSRGNRVVVDGGSGDDRIDHPGPWTDSRLGGGAGDDRITGSSGRNDLDGGAGDDRLTGGRGADVLRGGPGADRLLGQAGTDILIGGPDLDRLNAGPRGPKERLYASSDRLKVFLRVRRGKIVSGDMTLRLRCDDGKSYVHRGIDAMRVARYDRRTGRFEGSESVDYGWGETSFDAVEGLITGRRVTGRVTAGTDWIGGAYGSQRCWSGRSRKDPWVRFRADRLPDARQIVRQ